MKIIIMRKIIIVGCLEEDFEILVKAPSAGDEWKHEKFFYSLFYD